MGVSISTPKRMPESLTIIVSLIDVERLKRPVNKESTTIARPGSMVVENEFKTLDVVCNVCQEKMFEIDKMTYFKHPDLYDEYKCDECN
jgi:hypothetical protein